MGNGIKEDHMEKVSFTTKLERISKDNLIMESETALKVYLCIQMVPITLEG